MFSVSWVFNLALSLFFSAMVTRMDGIYDLVFPLSYYWQLFNLCSVYGTRQCY